MRIVKKNQKDTRRNERGRKKDADRVRTSILLRHLKMLRMIVPIKATRTKQLTIGKSKNKKKH
jgi:hypothetical protein